MARIGFIGAGNMARAMIASLRSKGSHRIIASDANARKLRNISVKTTTDNKEVVKKSKVVVIAVKPQDVRAVLEEIKKEVSTQIIVSIAAGVRIKTLEAALGKKKIVRVMPNTPCLVGEMAAGFAANSRLTGKDVEMVRNILNSCGTAFQMKEGLLDAVTGLSGSGPAFVAYLIEAFREAGKKEGLPDTISYELAVQTFYGTAKLLKEKQISLDELIAMVSSPKGTTVAGRKVLETSDVKGVIAKTIRRAAERSREMGNQDGK